jgi:hypothetical protein
MNSEGHCITGPPFPCKNPGRNLRAGKFPLFFRTLALTIAATASRDPHCRLQGCGRRGTRREKLTIIKQT